MYRDVDKRTRLGGLEKVKKPIEAGVVAIHPDELKSEDFIHQCLKKFLGHPVDDHENDRRRINTKMIHISRDMFRNDLTSEPRDVFELYRATTDPRIDAKGVMPIPRWLAVSINTYLVIQLNGRTR